MRDRKTAKLERLVVDGAGKDRWFLRPGSRRRSWTWFDLDDMPPGVTGNDGWFEIERVRGHWRALRQMEAPATQTVAPIDHTAPWPRAPRTLGEVRAWPLGRLYLSCQCGGLWLNPRDVCRAFDGWTVENLQRAGFFRCLCGRVPAAAVYAWGAGIQLRVEHWPVKDTAGWIRC